MPEYHSEQLEDYPHSFGGVSLQAYPIYQHHQDVQQLLEAVRPSGSKDPMAQIENIYEPLNFPPKTLLSRILPGNQHDLVLDHSVHQHVKDGNG